MGFESLLTYVFIVDRTLKIVYNIVMEMDLTKYDTPLIDNVSRDKLESVCEDLERKLRMCRAALELFEGQFNCYECTGTAEDVLALTIPETNLK